MNKNLSEILVFVKRLKSVINKRKRTDYDDLPNKRKIVNNSDDDDDERLTLSPRISPKLTKSFSSMVVLLLILITFKIIDFDLGIISMSTLSTIFEE